MIELSMIRDLVAIFGVIAGFSYYVLTVRNSQRNQELSLKAQEQALETRQTQIFMHIWQQLNSEETNKSIMELLNLEIKGFEEYLQKKNSGKILRKFAIMNCHFVAKILTKKITELIVEKHI